jgi:hypothetical protein
MKGKKIKVKLPASLIKELDKKKCRGYMNSSSTSGRSTGVNGQLGAPTSLAAEE